MKREIWIVTLAVSIMIGIIASINIVRLNSEYQAGLDEYKELKQYVKVVETSEKEQGPVAKLPELQQQENADSIIPMQIEVDFEKLKEINEDLIGWLYYEPLEISYPIVRGNDNDYYTLYTFEKEKNSSGAIFMDFLNKPNMDNYNTIIYGHNMRNGSMFGSLKKLLNDASVIDENPNFYVYTQDRIFMYEIVACYITNDRSDTYNLVQSEEDQQAYVKYIKEVSAYDSTRDIKPDDKIVTLSTCHGLHSTNRTVVHGVLIAQEDR